MERGVVESGGAGLVDFLEFVVCLEEGRMCGGGGGGEGGYWHERRLIFLPCGLRVDFTDTWAVSRGEPPRKSKDS